MSKRVIDSHLYCDNCKNEDSDKFQPADNWFYCEICLRSASLKPIPKVGMMTSNQIVMFALEQREEGYISGLMSAKSFMAGWVKNSNLDEGQKSHLLAGLNEMLNGCTAGGNDENKR